MAISKMIFVAIAALGIVPQSTAEPTTATIANGVATFSIPEGWIVINEQKYDLYIESPDTSVDAWPGACRVKALTLPNLRIRDQEHMNEHTRTKPQERASPTKTMLNFSNTEVVDGVSVISYAVLEYGTTFSIRQAQIYKGLFATAIQADCTTRKLTSAADKQAVTAFLGSMRFKLD